MKIFKYVLVLLILLIGKNAFSIIEQNSSENEFVSKIDEFNKNTTLQYISTLKDKDDSINLIQLRKLLSNQNYDINLFFELLDKCKFSKTKENLSLKIDSIKKISSNNFNLFFQKIENLNINSLKDIEAYYLSERENLAPDFQSSLSEVNQIPLEPILEEKEVNLLEIKNIIIFILLVLIIVYIISNQNLKKKLKNQKRDLKRINNQQNLAYKIQSESDTNYNLQRKLKEKDEEIDDLKRKLKEKDEEIDDLKRKLEYKVNSEIESDVKIKYFRAPISNGSFSVEHQSDKIEIANTMFKFEIQKDEKTAKFEFCGDEKSIKHAINFSEKNIEIVCDYTNTKDNFKSQIINIEPGIVELQDQIWIVKQKAKIKFQ
jgi:hypothetical protein